MWKLKTADYNFTEFEVKVKKLRIVLAAKSKQK